MSKPYKRPKISKWLTNLFLVEIRNKKTFSDKPATLGDALASVVQAPKDVLMEWLGTRSSSVCVQAWRELKRIAEGNAHRHLRPFVSAPLPSGYITEISFHQDVAGHTKGSTVTMAGFGEGIDKLPEELQDALLKLLDHETNFGMKNRPAFPGAIGRVGSKLTKRGLAKNMGRVTYSQVRGCLPDVYTKFVLTPKGKMLAETLLAVKQMQTGSKWMKVKVA